MPDVSNT